MDDSEFWSIVESSKAFSDGSFDSYAESLAEQLSALSPETIVAFQRMLDELRDRAYSWDLWGAAYIMGSGCRLLARLSAPSRAAMSGTRTAKTSRGGFPAFFPVIKATESRVSCPK
jgi:hypothetical protein